MKPRRRNEEDERIPTWLWALPLGIVATALVAAGVVSRRARADGPIYLYWTELQPTAFMDKFPGYVPHLQREDGTEHVTLSGRLTESQALSDARTEIDKRGGIAREGQPV